MFKRLYLLVTMVVTAACLGGCKLAVLNPKGLIAAQEKQLLIEATLLMLLIVVPTILLSLWVAWKFRASNTKATYSPHWYHSTFVEAVCWIVPCIVIAVLAYMTWQSTHKLDPYRPIVMDGKKPIVIEAIALDWKWLFIYPEQHIASVNFIQIPINHPIFFKITADAPMNSLEIPQLAGQIYAMAGMQTKLYLTADEVGIYRGLSTNFSGDGFSDMHFQVKASSEADFSQWVKRVRRVNHPLNFAEYNRLVLPSENNPASYFSTVDPNIYHHTIMKYMMPMSHKKKVYQDKIKEVHRVIHTKSYA